MFLTVWAFLKWASWNPLLTSVVGGGMFALLGAIIGGRYLLHAQRAERKLERLAAARALSVELELNTKSTATLAIAGNTNPRDYLIVRPALSRAVFDQRLALLSEFLAPQEFQALAGLYARAAMSFALLETSARDTHDMTPRAVEIFATLAKQFATASAAVAAHAWPQDEQHRLNEARAEVLAELRQIPTYEGDNSRGLDANCSNSSTEKVRASGRPGG